MYDNIGGKIKAVAFVEFGIGFIAAILSGVFLLGSMGLLALLVILFGIIGAWISSLMIYGFGEIIDKLCEIAKNTSDTNCQMD